MQQPTHPRLHLRDTHDAHVIFEAVRRGLLAPITRELNEIECNDLVRSGAVFVWIEAEDDSESGLMRWTDGHSWGRTRLREPYLFYDQEMPFDEARAAIERYRLLPHRYAERVIPNPDVIPAAIEMYRGRKDRTEYYRHSGLVKQTYSAWVTFSPESKPLKWHITAYFTYADLPQLPSFDDYDLFRNLIIPEGVYTQCGRNVSA